MVPVSQSKDCKLDWRDGSWVKALATKPDDLTLIPEATWWGAGRANYGSLSSDLHTRTVVHMSTHSSPTCAPTTPHTGTQK